MRAWGWKFAFLSRCFDAMGGRRHLPSIGQRSYRRPFFSLLTLFYSSVSGCSHEYAFTNCVSDFFPEHGQQRRHYQLGD